MRWGVGQTAGSKSPAAALAVEKRTASGQTYLAFPPEVRPKILAAVEKFGVVAGDRHHGVEVYEAKSGASGTSARTVIEERDDPVVAILNEHGSGYIVLFFGSSVDQVMAIHGGLGQPGELIFFRDEAERGAGRDAAIVAGVAAVAIGALIYVASRS